MSANPASTQGLSQVEMLILISVIGIISAIGISVSQTQLLSGSRETKLQQDTRVLNAAISSYLASGGDLDGVSDPQEILKRLKSSLSDEQKALTPGMSGGFLDERVTFELQNEKEGARKGLRLHWDGKSKRFVMATGGAPGIKALTLDDAATGNLAGSDPHRKSSFTYASDDNWIWDYTEAMPTAPPGPSVFPTEAPPSSGPPTVPTSLPPALPSSRNDLLPPAFSVPGGNYPTSHFPIALALINPNPAGSSQIFYSIDHAEWSELLPGRTFPAPAGALVKAQAVPFDASEWNASRMVHQEYKAVIHRLEPPQIDFSADRFTSGTRSIQVTLVDLNPPGKSALFYQVIPVPGGGGAATDLDAYAGGFAVNASEYPNGFGIRAYAATRSADFTDSLFVSRYATEEMGLFSGHLDLDTSTEIAQIGKGSTGAHTHDITGKYGISTINFFSLPDSKQIEVNEAIRNPNQAFKLLVVNGNLSPGLTLTVQHEEQGKTKTVSMPVNEYDDTPTSDLTIYSLSGSGATARLNGLAITMNQDVINNAGVIPTNTGDVRSNVLGKNSEWRNGALTIQAVAVGSDGVDRFTTSTSLSAGDHGAAQSGLLWEAALFWHWDGDSYHESGNSYLPGAPNSIRGLLESGKKK